MGWISAVFVEKAIGIALAGQPTAGRDRDDWQRDAGLDPPLDSDPGQMVADTDFFALLETLAAAVPDGRAIPIALGAAMRCDDYGAFGLAFKSAPDLAGSYARVARFGKVVTSIANFRVVETDRSIGMEVMQAGQPRLGLTMTNELALAAAWSLSTEVSQQPLVPKAVHLMARRPDDDGAYRRHFGCPVHFEAARDALEIDLPTARRPNRLADHGIARFFEDHLDRQLAALPQTQSLAQRVLAQIGPALSAGAPSLAQTAAALGLSSRTLQRRLLDAELSYQDLVAEARRTMSADLLRSTEYSLAEIAFLTGFSDQSTFSRAFKRWHGCAPAAFRRGGPPG